MRWLFRLIATGMYSGFSPIAPGTVGSLIAVLIARLIPVLNPWIGLSAIVLFFFAGVRASGEVEKNHGHDASVINIDEMVGMWISLFALPFHSAWFWPVGAFLLFRVCDIVKPFPAGVSQKLPRGWGVMVDDVVAGVYANLGLRLIHWLVLKVH